MAQSRYWTALPTWPVYLGGIAPGVWLFWRGVNNQLGADPVAALENGLGEWALIFLLAGLCVTPMMRFARVNLVKYRRALGLVAFAYVVAHLATYVLLDQALRWDAIIADITKRPYIMLGMAAFVALVPLAVTSNMASIRRLGAAGWNKLHKLTYPAVILAAAHYVMLEKTWQAEPLAYLAAAAGLVALRRFYPKRKRAQAVSGATKPVEA